MTWVVRFVTHLEIEIYQRLGWRCTHYGVRGDDLDCFVVSWLCVKE